MTDKAMIQTVGRTDGMHFPPAFYKNEVRRRFGREVSSASVTKALGAYKTRLTLPEKALLRKANDLLAACHFDKALATAMVGKAAVS